MFCRLGMGRSNGSGFAFWSSSDHSLPGPQFRSNSPRCLLAWANPGGSDSPFTFWSSSDHFLSGQPFSSNSLRCLLAWAADPMSTERRASRCRCRRGSGQPTSGGPTHHSVIAKMRRHRSSSPRRISPQEGADDSEQRPIRWGHVSPFTSETPPTNASRRDRRGSCFVDCE